MVAKLTFGLLVAACAVPAAAQGDGSGAQAAGVPPPIVLVPRPVPPPVSRPQAVRTIAPPPVQLDYGSAPPAAATPAIPLEKKAAKELARTRQAKMEACFKRSELKSWMAKGMLADCDWLLAQPSSDEDSWDYRARVLQFRALALINLGGDARAREALDESDAIAAAHSDPLFDLGVGAGNDMLRAYMEGRAGNREKANALLEQIRHDRPYVLSVVRATDRIAGSFETDPHAAVKRLEDRIPMDPNVTRSLLFLHLLEGDLDAAARVADQVTLTEPKLRGGWQMVRDAGDPDDVERNAVFAGTKAYIAATRGDTARSNALIAEARADIEEYVGKDPRVEGEKIKASKTAVSNWLARQAQAGKLQKLLSEWETAIGFRSKLGSNTMEEMLDVVGKFENRAQLFPAMVDLLRSYGKHEATSEGAQATALADQLVERVLLDQNQVPAGELGTWLPLPESLDQVPKFASTASKWLMSDGSGYSQAKEGDGTIRTVRYETQVGAPALVDEMLMMAIANYAEQEGYDAFMILSRRTFGRTLTISGMYSRGTPQNAGYEAQARVRLVKTQALPPELLGQESRLLLAKDVHDMIVPRYTAYIARKEAEKAAEKAAKAKSKA